MMMGSILYKQKLLFSLAGLPLRCWNTGGNQGHLYYITQASVIYHSEKYHRIWVDFGSNVLSSSIYLTKSQPWASVNIEQNTFGTSNRQFKQRIKYCFFSSFPEHRRLHCLRQLPSEHWPGIFIIARTSAKVNLFHQHIDQFGQLPSPPWVTASSALRKASSIGTSLSTS